MTASIDLDALCGHQELDLGILTRGVAALEQGPAATVAAASRLPKELGDALRAYQIFKHERIFDPTIASGDEQRAQMRRHMKIACISAGEVFRAHLGRWDMAAIVADWARYKPPARLTANQLHRHIRRKATASRTRARHIAKLGLTRLGQGGRGDIRARSPAAPSPDR